MIAWLCLAVLGGPSVLFKDLPLGDEIAVGRRIYRSGAGIDRTLLGDRAVLGTWFDGRIRRAVDTATWVSPRFVSRWLGYMAEQYGWSESEVVKHWSGVQARLEHNVTFIVRLSAFPKLDTLDFGLDSPSKPETLQGLRFRLSYNSMSKRLGGENLPLIASNGGEREAAIEKYESDQILARPFFSLTRLAPLFLGPGETDKPDDGIPLGDFYGVVYSVSFPVTPQMVVSPELDFTVQLPTKRESAAFKLFACLTPAQHDPGGE